jgi:hypothetical protein
VLAITHTTMDGHGTETASPGFGESGPNQMFGLGAEGIPSAESLVAMWVVGTTITLGLIALGVFLAVSTGRAAKRIATKNSGRVGDYEDDWDEVEAEPWERMTERAAQHAPRCGNYDKIAMKLRSCKKSAACDMTSERRLHLAVQQAFTGDCRSAEKLYRKSFV